MNIMGHPKSNEWSYQKPKRELSWDPVSNKVRSAYEVEVQPMHHMVVEITCAKAGLLLLQNEPKTAHKHLTPMENGVIDILPNRPFKVLMNNVGNHTVLLDKNTTIAMTLLPPI